jgi:hypothetical protein
MFPNIKGNIQKKLVVKEKLFFQRISKEDTKLQMLIVEDKRNFLEEDRKLEDMEHLSMIEEFVLLPLL